MKADRCFSPLPIHCIQKYRACTLQAYYTFECIAEAQHVLSGVHCRLTSDMKGPSRLVMLSRKCSIGSVLTYSACKQFDTAPCFLVIIILPENPFTQLTYTSRKMRFMLLLMVRQRNSTYLENAYYYSSSTKQQLVTLTDSLVLRSLKQKSTLLVTDKG